jgi:hypothetical protein
MFRVAFEASFGVDFVEALRAFSQSDTEPGRGRGPS